MFKLVASFGASVKSNYTLFNGTKEECKTKLSEYPSIQDEGWGNYDFGSSTTVVQEICHIEEVL